MSYDLPLRDRLEISDLGLRILERRLMICIKFIPKSASRDPKAEVSPANTIPQTAKRAGATIIEINVTATVLTNHLTDISLQGRAGDMVSRFVLEVEKLAAE